MTIEDWQVPLWDAINRYTETCGGKTSTNVLGNTRRMLAVSEVNNAVRTALEPAKPAAVSAPVRSLTDALIQELELNALPLLEAFVRGRIEREEAPGDAAYGWKKTCEGARSAIAAIKERRRAEESAKGYVGGGRHEPGGMLDPHRKRDE